MPMTVYADEIHINLATGVDMADITRELESLVVESKIQNGSLSATMIGSTGSLTTIEHEPGVIADLRQAINRLAPPDMPYEHEKAWHDGNGHSHVQAALIGPSLSMQIRYGKIRRGTWQQVVAINHDNRARKRTIAVTVIGE